VIEDELRARMGRDGQRALASATKHIVAHGAAASPAARATDLDRAEVTATDIL